jgi:hypothetical protein
MDSTVARPPAISRAQSAGIVKLDTTRSGAATDAAAPKNRNIAPKNIGKTRMGRRFGKRAENASNLHLAIVKKMKLFCCQRRFGGQSCAS